MTNFLHSFLFLDGKWQGEGSITFSHMPGSISFKTEWKTKRSDDIKATQMIQITGSTEEQYNRYQLSDFEKDAFSVTLENEIFGKVSGKGVIDGKTIAWEFRGADFFEGYEVYAYQEDSSYKFHAEYASDPESRTVIDGIIHKA